eukprot:PhF_6_TR26139/c0_g1_i2/m.37014
MSRMKNLQSRTEDVLKLMEYPLTTPLTTTNVASVGSVTPRGGGKRGSNAGTPHHGSGGHDFYSRTPTASSFASGVGGSGGGPDDHVLGETLQHRLASLKHLRLQIEELARRHKEEEETLSSTVHIILSRSKDTQQHMTEEFTVLQKEVLALREDKKRIVGMCEKFKAEGDAVIHRMHNTLQALQKELHDEKKSKSVIEEQCRRRLDEARNVIVMQQEEIQMLRSGRQHASGNVHNADAIEEFERVTSEYAVLLEDAQNVIAELKEENERLKSMQGGLENSGGGGGTPVQRYLQALKEEKRNRLLTEEQAERIISEQQRTIQALEVRLKARGVVDDDGTGERRRSATRMTSPTSPIQRHDGTHAENSTVHPNKHKAEELYCEQNHHSSEKEDVEKGEWNNDANSSSEFVVMNTPSLSGQKDDEFMLHDSPTTATPVAPPHQKINKVMTPGMLQLQSLEAELLEVMKD